MLKKIGDPAPPRGFMLLLFRLPICLYKIKAGFLLGSRFLLLKHWGRKSGTLKETVVEIIDRDDVNGSVYVASGFGDKSQWFKNISANPNVVVVLKNKARDAKSEILPTDQAEIVLRRYAAKNLKLMKAVARLSGYEMDGTDEDVLAFSQVIKIIRFVLV